MSCNASAGFVALRIDRRLASAESSRRRGRRGHLEDALIWTIERECLRQARLLHRAFDPCHLEHHAKLEWPRRLQKLEGITALGGQAIETCWLLIRHDALP